MTRLLTRIAAGVALMQGLAHGILFVESKPHSAPEASVVAAMRDTHFLMGGALHSYWQMYFGYGLMAAASCLFEAALLWFIAPLARDNPVAFRPLAATILAANVVHALLVLRYFFLVPLVPDSIIMLLLAAGLFVLQRRRGESSPIFGAS